MKKTYLDHHDPDNTFAKSDFVGLFNVGVGCIVLNDQGEVLLTQRSHKNLVSPGSWEIIFGRVNQGELIYFDVVICFCNNFGQYLKPS